MTGRLSAFTELMESIALSGAAIVGGWMIVHSSPRSIFLWAACVSMVLFGMGFWKPAAIFRNTDESPVIEFGLGSAWFHLRRIWPVIAICMLYNFSPGWGTPLFYYLTDQVHLSAEVYGTCRAVIFAGNAAATAAYGLLCLRYPLKRLLWWSIVFNIAPGLLFLVIDLPYQAIVVSGVLGIIAGFANVALFDLLMRACPPMLEGSVSMMGVSALGIAAAIGDLVGAAAYQYGGFVLCIALDAIATLLVVPLLVRLPHRLISLKDGERSAEPEGAD